MVVYFDCDILDSSRATCKLHGRHDPKTIALYTVKLGSGRAKIVRMCRDQATDPANNWNVIAPFALPAKNAPFCQTCGTHQDDISGELCSKKRCPSCCEEDCDHCEKCSKHLDPGQTLCNAKLCRTCCIENCKKCAYCGLHGESICELSSFCSGCCETRCTVCSTCHEHVDGLCEHCNHCIDACCECEICPDCSRLVSCHDCGYCEPHCECETEEEDGDQVTMSNGNYGQPWKAKDSSQLTLFNCSRLVGIEWEYNSALHQNSLATWRTKWNGQLAYDGSCGQEAVTPPLAGDHMIHCLTELGEAFKKDEAEIDARCGVHVHVDASDIAWQDMFRVLKVYAHVEPMLYMLAGQDRIVNRYCIPCGESFLSALSKSDKKGAVLEAAYTERGGKTGHQYARGKPGKKDNNRYKGLNLCPWLAGRKVRAKDTTVEFRIHRHVPHKDTLRVINWTKICAKIVDWSANASDDEVEKLPKSALRTLCTVIAPECSGWILERLKCWRHATSVANGVPRRIAGKYGKYALKLHA